MEEMEVKEGGMKGVRASSESHDEILLVGV